MVLGWSVFVVGIRSVQSEKLMWLFLILRISLRLIAVSKARVIIRPISESSTRHSCSPFSNLLVRPLSTFGRETSGMGFFGIQMPQSLSAIVKTRLRITSSLLREAGETIFRRISLYLDTWWGERWMSFKCPRCFLRCWIRYCYLYVEGWLHPHSDIKGWVEWFCGPQSYR